MARAERNAPAVRAARAEEALQAKFRAISARRRTGGNKALRKKLELSSPTLPYDHLANDGYYIKY